jgi:hypothetical protein
MANENPSPCANAKPGGIRLLEIRSAESGVIG